MPIYEPSPSVMSTLMAAETPNSVSLPLAVLVAGVLSQVEATIELTNRICDKYLHPVDCVRSSAA